jgi:hypothetical protein
VKSAIGIFICITVSLCITLCGEDINNITFSSPWTQGIFPFIRAFFNVFHEGFIVLVQRFLPPWLNLLLSILFFWYYHRWNFFLDFFFGQIVIVSFNFVEYIFYSYLAKLWKQHTLQSMGRWRNCGMSIHTHICTRTYTCTHINSCTHTHTHMCTHTHRVHYLAFEKEILTFVTMSMNLEVIMLSE